MVPYKNLSCNICFGMRKSKGCKGTRSLLLEVENLVGKLVLEVGKIDGPWFIVKQLEKSLTAFKYKIAIWQSRFPSIMLKMPVDSQSC